MDNTFIPTKEQLFDYHLGITDPELSGHIEAYLAQNPEAQKVLSEFSQLETAFTELPLQHPQDHIIQRVEKQAAKQLKPKLFERLLIVPKTRAAAWVAMLFVVVGLSYGLHELRSTNPYYSAPSVAKIPPIKYTPEENNGIASYTAVQGKKMIDPLTKETPEAAIMKSYMKGKLLYNQKNYVEASKLFNHIMTTNPKFDKRIELYTYWIDALEQLNEHGIAMLKKEELKKIQEEK